MSAATKQKGSALGRSMHAQATVKGSDAGQAVYARWLRQDGLTLRNWVTLSPSGTHVYVEGDTITRGPATLANRKLHELRRERVSHVHGQTHPTTGKSGPDAGEPDKAPEVKPPVPAAPVPAAPAAAAKPPSEPAKPTAPKPAAQPEPSAAQPKPAPKASPEVVAAENEKLYGMGFSSYDVRDLRKMAKAQGNVNVLEAAKLAKAVARFEIRPLGVDHLQTAVSWLQPGFDMSKDPQARRVLKAAGTPLPEPPPAPKELAPLKAGPDSHTTWVANAFERCPGAKHNIVDLVDLWRESHLTLPELHHVVKELYKHKIVTLTQLEGREGNTPGQLAAGIPHPTSPVKYGYVSIRDGKEDEFRALMDSRAPGATKRSWEGFLTRKAESFFESCQRDEHGHCLPGTGGSASGGKPEGAKPAAETPAAKPEAQPAAHQTPHEAAHASWSQRDAARTGRREKAKSARSLAMQDRTRDVKAAVDKLSVAVDAKGVDAVVGDFVKQMDAVGESVIDAIASDDVVDKFVSLQSDLESEVRGSAKKYAKAVEKHAAAETALRDIEGDEPDEPPEPPDPAYPEGPGDDADDDHWDQYNDEVERIDSEHEKAKAKWEKVHDRWEAAHEKWESKRDRAAEKVEAYLETAGEALGELEESMTDMDAGVSNEASDLLDAEESQLDDEEGDDQEPEIPDEEPEEGDDDDTWPDDEEEASLTEDSSEETPRWKQILQERRGQ